MNNFKRMPSTLKVVVGLLILNGFLFAIRTSGTSKTELYVLDIIVGISLLSLRPWSRIVALFSVGSQICFYLYGVYSAFFVKDLILLGPTGPFGLYIVQSFKPFLPVYIVSLILGTSVAVWEWRLLTNSDVKGLFVRP